jgi:hypothetical protein
MFFNQNLIQLSFFIVLTYVNYITTDDVTTISFDNNSTILIDDFSDSTATQESVNSFDSSSYVTIGSNATTEANSNSSSNSSSSDDYVYEVYVYEDVVANETSNASKFHFSGDDQPRPGLGINVGWITPDMDQWVFTNKFKHAKLAK